MTATVEPPARLSGYGITARLPSPWEGRLFRRPQPDAHFASPQARATAPATPGGGALGWAGEQTTPVLHLGNFALPNGRGDFGTGAVELMRDHHAFIALLEYGPSELGSALFSSTGLPRPTTRDFQLGALQQRLPGQLGYQRFFTVGNRPMCLYVVLGSAARAVNLCSAVNQVLEGIEVS